MCQPVMVSQTSWHCEPHGTLRCTGAELDSLQSCSLIWHPWSSLVSFSFDTSRCSADLIPLSSSFFFFLGGFRVTCEPVSIWHLGMIFFSRHLVWPYGLLWIWSSCHRTPSPKGSSVRESCKNDLTFQAAEATHYNDYILYIYIRRECIEYFIPIYDVFVSSIMCPIWLSFYESYFFNDYV